MTAIPPPLLHYKYAPQDFNDQFMKEQARRQIDGDALTYERPKQQWRDHVFMFTVEQVKGREPSFAAEELLPIYKQGWTNFARAIPDTLHFQTDVQLEYLAYINGAIRGKLEHHQHRLHELGLGHLPTLSGKGVPKLPNTITQAGHVGAYRLRLDRVLRVPPLTMDRAAAEKLWLKPACNPMVPPRPEQQPGQSLQEARRVAQDAATKCATEHQAFKPRITIIFDIKTEDVVSDDGNKIVKAKLVGARIFGSRNEFLQNIPGADFPEKYDFPVK